MDDIALVKEWAELIRGIADLAENPRGDVDPSTWEAGNRRAINGGRLDAEQWVTELRSSWDEDAIGTSWANACVSTKMLATDALHLVTTMQNSDTWGVPAAEWICQADREIVERVRNASALILRVLSLAG